ncbi:MAG TPA: WecB/TagA/CpsF family glycosyltransferase [Usitatibacter sp.]|nr:WecB/TagA/CpsF family glycosyltransferase [Usitatibacter sp.]
MSAATQRREEAAGARSVAPAMSYRRADRVAGALDLLGLCVHDVSATGVLDYMDGVIRAREQAVILHANAFAGNLAARHDWMRQAYREAQMVFCDGDGIRMACRALGLPVPPKVTYARWLPLAAEWCERQGHSIYLLGGRPGVAELAARRFQERHPDIRIAGTHHGYFEKSGPESEAVMAAINAARPDVLLVCFGMPIQERWVQSHASRLATHVILTGGAALDYAAGIATLTPPWMIRLQLEWLYRLWKEPRRLFTRYVVGNPEFILRVLAERVRPPHARTGAET